MLLDVKNINFLKFLVVKIQKYLMFEYLREVINVKLGNSKEEVKIDILRTF